MRLTLEFIFKCKKLTCTSYPNVTAIVVIRNANKNSNFLKPYLSKNKNVNVSKIVINVPAHNGTLKKWGKKNN